MQRKHGKRILGGFMAATILLTVILTGLSFMGVSAAVADDVRAAAKTYVEAQKNNVTPWGLLAAVKAVASTATLDWDDNLEENPGTDKANHNYDLGGDSDFFIKHAVNGVKDVMKDGAARPAGDIPLNIAGSDGAVAAVFEVGSERITFAASFAHEVETITIDPAKIAVAGTSDQLTYAGADKTGNITGVAAGVEKIVFPNAFAGTMTDLSSAGANPVNNDVKVVIIDKNNMAMRTGAYRKWQNLIAVEFGPHASAYSTVPGVTASAYWLFGSDANTFADSVFAACPELKYVKMPQYMLSSNGITGYLAKNLFMDSTKLETVVHPRKVRMNWGEALTTPVYLLADVFRNTAVRDIFLPTSGAAAAGFTGDDGTGVAISPEENADRHAFWTENITTGTRNVVAFGTPMTFTRAMALAAAEVGELNRTLEAESMSPDEAMAAVKPAIDGSKDAGTFRDGLTYGWSGPSLTISDGTDTFSFVIAFVDVPTTITALSVEGYGIAPAFSPKVLAYTVTVPNLVTSLTVNYTKVPGAVVGTITGNTGFVVGDNTITIPVTPAGGGAVVNYTITVTRMPLAEASVEQKVRTAAAEYVAAEKNNVTPWGLLAAVKAEVPSATLSWNGNLLQIPSGVKTYHNYDLGSSSDFFIKHAVNGVKDVMAGGAERPTGDIPLDIPGSDGAVAAIFGVDGTRITFSASFPHEVETIVVNPANIAIAGVSTTLTLTGANITGVASSVEKIVIPNGFGGNMAALATGNNENTLLDIVNPVNNNVKVVVLDHKKALLTEGFRAWQKLTAVQFGPNSAGGYWLFGDSANVAAKRVFANCPELKYVKLPDLVISINASTGYLGEAAFSNCVKLETLIHPKQVDNRNTTTAVTTKFNVFRNTSIRDHFLPGPNNAAHKGVGIAADENDNASGMPTAAQTAPAAFWSDKFTSGTRNVVTYDTPMSFTRAVALATAKAGELARFGGIALADLEATIKEAITGSADAAAYKAGLTYTRSGFATGDVRDTGTLVVSDGIHTFDIAVVLPKTLVALSVDDYTMKPDFNAAVQAYTVTVANETTSLKINAVPVPGATVGTITGNSDFAAGDSNVVTIPVATAGGATVNYTITVTRDKVYSLSEAAAVAKDAAAAYDKAVNDTHQYTQDKIIADLQAALRQAMEPTGFTLTLGEYYLKRSVPGARDGNTVMVAGHNGYITTKATLTKASESGEIPLTVTINPFMAQFDFAASEVSRAEDFVLYDNGTILAEYKGNAKKIVIPDGVVEMEFDWYQGEKPEDVVALIIPDSVEILAPNLCARMRNLEVVRMGDRVTELSDAAFSHCYFLQYLRLSENLNIIGQTSFEYTQALRDLRIPDSVTRIHSKAFWISGVRDFTLSTKLDTLVQYAISYPARAVNTNEQPTITQEEMTRLHPILTSHPFDRTVTVLNPEMFVDDDTCITSDVKNNFVRVPGPEANNPVFPADKRSKAPADNADLFFTTFTFDLNMTLTESAARAMYMLDSMVLTEETQAGDIVSKLQTAYLSTTVGAPTWKEAFAISEETGMATGVLALTAGGITFDIVINRKVGEGIPEVPTNPTTPVDPTSPTGPAPGATIKGHLTDENGDPLAGYTLILKSDSTTLSANTDETGYFEFPNVPAGEYTVWMIDEYGSEISSGFKFSVQGLEVVTLSATWDGETFAVKIVSRENPNTGVPAAGYLVLAMIPVAMLLVVSKRKRLKTAAV